MKTTILALSICAVSILAAESPETHYVRLDGANGAFTSIQAAVDAASSGDIIRIASGMYDTGSTTDAFSKVLENRVYIDKPLTLIGEDRHTTIIKGSRADVAEDSAGLGLGEGAVRCIGINAKNVRLENLTLTGGATCCKTSGNDDANANGGAIYAPNGCTGIVVVDCIISNNVAWRAGAARYANDTTCNMLFARCHLDNNRSAYDCPVSRGATLAHCLITKAFAGSSTIYSGCLVNCTVADGNCRSTGGNTTSFRAYNCIFADAWYKLDYVSSYSNCVISSCQNFGTSLSSSQTNSCVLGEAGTGAGFDHFMAPPLNDYRLHSGADYALNAGSADYLELISAEFRFTDFYGNEFETNGTSIAAGCSQIAVAPAGGKIVFNPESFIDAASVSCGAGYTFSGTTNNYRFGSSRCHLVQMKQLGYIRTDSWPGIVEFDVETVSWKDLYGFKASGVDTVWRYPHLDGKYLVAPPSSTSTVLTLTPKKAENLIYVDQDASAEDGDGSSTAPFTDLQTAINSVPTNTYAVIRSRGGRFAEGGEVNGGLMSRVVVSGRYVRIVGEGGPVENLIVGAADSDGVEGMGPDAVRCVALGADCALQGFTLLEGCTDVTDATGKRGAGAYLEIGAQVLDCVISNCVGVVGAAVSAEEKNKKSNSYIFRSVVSENRSLDSDGTVKGGGIIRNTVAISTIFNGNDGQLTGAYEEQPFYFCTIASLDSASINYIGSTSLLYNSIVYMPNGNKINSAVAYGGAFDFSGGAVSSDSLGYLKSNVWLADPVNGDFRPATVSPAKTAANLEYGDLLHVAIGRDAFSHEFALFDGKPVCGAVHSFAPTVVVKSDNDEIALSGSRTNVFSQAGGIEFVAQKATVRPFLGIEVAVNGSAVTNLSASYVYSVAALDDSPETIELSVNALYDTNWYVDGNAGDDSGFGTVNSPKLTLAAALTNAISGDVVHVASGEYRTGKMYQTKQLGNNSGDYSLASRAVVPDGVELRGAGAESTFIVGEEDADASEGLNGCGPNAVRCVALGTGSKLKGFTLVGGRTAVDGSADSFHGGGVLASYRQPLAQIEDCIITNCVARRGGGGMFGLYNRCRFFSNATVEGGNGAALRGNGDGTAYLYNSVVDGCVGWATAYMLTEIGNCTFGEKSCDANGGIDGATVIQDCFTINNTLILGKRTIGVASAEKISVMNGCVFSDKTSAYLSERNVTNGCIVTSMDELGQVGDDYCPIIGLNPAVDSADASIYDDDILGSKDVYGNPRMVNGRRLDVGAVESDWKGEYSKALGNRVNVTEASADVLLDDTVSGVQIPSGAKLSLAYGREGTAGERAEIKASVAEGASLAVDAGSWGQTLASGEGQAFTFRTVADYTDFVFSADGGTAVLNSMTRKSPFAFVVR